MRRAFTLFSCVFSVLGCQTPRVKEVAQIQPGMNKSEVLATAGGPDRTDRKHGQDEWVYVIPGHRQDPDQIKSVLFTEGRVTFVGEPIKPLISAEEQDKINEEANAKSDAEDRATLLEAQEVTRKFFENGVVDPNAPIPETGQSTFVPLEDYQKQPPTAPAATGTTQ